MEKQLITTCWNCKTKYSFVKNPYGATVVVCPKCKNKALIKDNQQPSQQPQPKQPQHNLGESRRLQYKSITGLSSLIVIFLCVMIIVSTGYAVFTQMDRASLEMRLNIAQQHLTETQDDLLTTQNNLLNTSSELSFMINNATSFQMQVETLQNQLVVTQNQLNEKTTQLISITELYNLTSMQSNNATNFTVSFFTGMSVYYNATLHKLTAFQKYNESNEYYDNLNWTNASSGFNETKTYYNTSKALYQLSAEKFSVCYNYTEDILYKNLTNKYYDMMISSSVQIGYLYNSTEFMRISSDYYIIGNNSDAENASDNASIQKGLYDAELIVYQSYYNETVNILSQIEKRQ